MIVPPTTTPRTPIAPAARDLRRQRLEVHGAAPLDTPLVDQAQEGLVYERARVAGTPRDEESRDVAFRSFAHEPRRAGAESDGPASTLSDDVRHLARNRIGGGAGRSAEAAPSSGARSSTISCRRRSPIGSPLHAWAS